MPVWQPTTFKTLLWKFCLLKDFFKDISTAELPWNCLVFNPVKKLNMALYPGQMVWQYQFQCSFWWTNLFCSIIQIINILGQSMLFSVNPWTKIHLDTHCISKYNLNIFRYSFRCEHELWSQYSISKSFRLYYILASFKKYNNNKSKNNETNIILYVII